MEKRTSLLIGLSTVVVITIVSWSLAGKPQEPSAPAVAQTPRDTVQPAGIQAVADPAPVPSGNPPPAVAQLIADSASGDAGKRAAAIAALADAPRAEALPVLGRILTDGEPQIDRPLALRSLRDLALNQGDDDGAIRDAVRQAIYHGDDLTKVDDVQEVLDIIEESQQR
jgi:hypothetical protein